MPNHATTKLNHRDGVTDMPLQNRMNPKGQLHSVKARGRLMGNRGQLHNEQQQILRPWKLQRWITCALEYQVVKRELMSPNSYTELFFLDEPTSSRHCWASRLTRRFASSRACQVKRRWPSCMRVTVTTAATAASR
ncbi:hypothetical protein FQZ97_850720 [compost metagenome]